MPSSSLLTSAGKHVYGLGAMTIGLIGLVWGDFADVWQPIQAFGNVPYRPALAYIAAVGLLLGGAAIQWRRTARAGALVVTILNLIFAVFWLPRVIGFPRIYGTWAGLVEAFAPVTAGIILCATLVPFGSPQQTTAARIARYLFGACAISFGVAHFLYVPQTASMVPSWMPFGQNFWALATGVFHLLAGLAILSGVLAIPAARLLTLMLIVFGVLVWLPQPFLHPHDHTAWGGNGINLALIGTAWVVADWLARDSSGQPAEPRRQEPGR